MQTDLFGNPQTEKRVSKYTGLKVFALTLMFLVSCYLLIAIAISDNTGNDITHTGLFRIDQWLYEYDFPHELSLTDYLTLNPLSANPLFATIADSQVTLKDTYVVTFTAIPNYQNYGINFRGKYTYKDNRIAGIFAASGLFISIGIGLPFVLLWEHIARSKA